jgi:hypothetical protein
MRLKAAALFTNMCRRCFNCFLWILQAKRMRQRTTPTRAR